MIDMIEAEMDSFDRAIRCIMLAPFHLMSSFNSLNCSYSSQSLINGNTFLASDQLIYIERIRSSEWIALAAPRCER